MRLQLILYLASAVYASAAMLQTSDALTYIVFNMTVTTIAVVDTLVTICPTATTLTFNGCRHTASAGETLTITECPCTVTTVVPIVTASLCKSSEGTPSGSLIGADGWPPDPKATTIYVRPSLAPTPVEITPPAPSTRPTSSQAIAKPSGPQVVTTSGAPGAAQGLARFLFALLGVAFGIVL